MGHSSHCGLLVRTCTPHICILGTAQPIALKFVVHLGANQLRAYHMPWVAYVFARAHCARMQLQLHVGVRISEMIAPIVLKFGLLLGVHIPIT